MKARPPAPTPQALLNQALAFHQAGQLGQATALYRQLLQVQPRNAEVLWLLGSVECQAGNLEQGAALLSRLVDIAPNHAYAHYNLGLALSKLGRQEEAIASYTKALAIRPDYAEAHINLGTALRDLNRLEQALASYERALAVRPDYAEAYYNRGLAFSQLDRAQEALASYEQALAIQPSYAEAFAQRGDILFKAGRFAAALASYGRALAITPDVDFLRGQALYSRMFLCDWSTLPAEGAQLVAQLARNENVTSPFAALALIDSPQVQRRASELWVAARYPVGRALSGLVRTGRHDKIRIAYFSSDFNDHPVTHLIAGLLERHDRTKFNVFAFALGAERTDRWRARVVNAVDQFIAVRAQTDTEIAATARALGIDIAVDLNGFTQDGRTGVFAERAAPLQLSYIGFAGTMGAPYIDYLVADSTIIPEDHRRFYSEKIVYLPSYQCNDHAPPSAERTFSRPDFGLPEHGFVFCSFNSNYKITPEVFAVWMRILTQVAGSVLWLYVSDQAAIGNLKAEAERRGIDAARVIFALRMPRHEHLVRLGLADLFLDTYPCNAGATASDALRTGLPLLTRSGESFASRIAASLLNAVGLPELITTTPQDYEALAVTLATDPGRLAALKQKLLANLPTCALFDTQRFTRHLESAFVAMYERYQNDLPPDHIIVT